MATQEQQNTMQDHKNGFEDHKNAFKDSVVNHKNAIKGSLKDQQASVEKTFHEGSQQAKEQASGLLAFLQRQMDRVIKPETRQHVYERTHVFAKERPLLFTFLVAQALASAVPLGLFAAFTCSVLVLSLGAALMFSLFWLGAAMVVLVPTLLVTVTMGSIVFFWAVAAQVAWATLPAGVRNLLTGRREGATEAATQGESDMSYSAAVARAKKAIKDSTQYRDGHGTNGNNQAHNGY